MAYVVDVPKLGPCDNCGKRTGTEKWLGEGGMLAFTHGWYKMWCKQCVLRAQIAYAEDRAREISELRKQLRAQEMADLGSDVVSKIHAAMHEEDGA